MTQATLAPSQYQLRAELETMVLGDLLGPAGGESEELTERTVRDRYLVGVLAPSRSSGAAAQTKEDAEEDDEEVPLIPDELSEGGSDTADDGKADVDTPVTVAHLPSSFGMTFCVDGEAKSIRVSGTWGQYKREKREDQTDHKGKTLLVWKRYSRGGQFEIPLKDGPIKAKAPDPQFPDIYVQGQIRKRDTHYAVTLFLVNAQEELRPKDEYHIFQPKLSVSGGDGQAIFCKRTSLSTNPDLEEQLMAMLYRHHVEFAVGHGISVHAEISPDSPEKATSIESVIVPAYEVPRTAPPTPDDADENPAFGKLSGLVLDMKLLAEADAKKLLKLLGPLTVAYEEWIEREQAKVSDPNEGLSHFGDAPQVALANCRLTLERIEEGLDLLTKDTKAFEAFQFTNRAMWLQRTHSIYAERVRRGEHPTSTRTSTRNRTGVGDRSRSPSSC
jgi:hypothetical protein